MKVCTLDLKIVNKNPRVLPRSGLGRPGLQRPPPGTLLATNLSRASQKGALASKQPDPDPAVARNIWDPSKREREITKI